MAGKIIPFIVFFIAFANARCTYAQTDTRELRNFQMSFTRVSEAWAKFNEALRQDFVSKNLEYPPKDIYIRAFKSQNEMELWARSSPASEYKLVKTMHICAISGVLGPKRAEGDRQVPEGFYFIEEFNPKSDYHLSLLINYPNFSDQLMGRGKLGGDIYIHGGCLTIGCMPMTNEGIQELYTVCLNARLNGQEYIPVHVFPTRLTKSGMQSLARQFPGDKVKQQFWNDLKAGYDHFEKYHKLLPVMYSPDGKYVN
ncbi:MAG: L,D-transpeptidase family protein [Bacteroidota bacterium]